jgi:ABC-2 type transport system permease protein
MTRAVDSVIHDLGYQRYTGARLGRWYGARTLFLSSLRTAFGLGRGAKAKIFPWLTAAMPCFLASIIVIIRQVTDEPVLTNVEFMVQFSLLIVLFVATVASEIISRDLSSGVLSLYFSRPIRRLDYTAAKLATLAAAIVLVLGIPQLILYLGALLGGKGVLDETRTFLGALTYVALCAVVMAPIAMLAASLARRRAFAAGAIAAVFLVTYPLSVGFPVIGLTNPLAVLAGMADWLYPKSPEGGGVDYLPGPVYLIVAVGMVAACAGGLIARYRKVAA